MLNHARKFHTVILKKVYLITIGTHWMLEILEVKGAATDASASDKDIPTSAAFKA